MTVALAIWSFGYWQWLLSEQYETALLWVKILSVGSLFIPVFFFHWISLLINKERINKIILWLSYAAAVSILFFANSPLFIASLEKKSIFTFWPNGGVVYDVFFSYIYIGLIIYSLYLLIRTYGKNPDTEKKGQILYIIFGALLGFGGGLTNFPLWFGIPIPPYGNFLVVAFPLLLGYSVLKYKLFNAKTIATEILVFFLAIILLIQAIISQSLSEKLLRGGLFVVVSIVGYLLIKSVYREVEQREKIESLATNLEKANSRLQDLDKQKSEFVSFATHQLRAPLTAMKGYASLLIDGDMGKLPAEAKLGVGRIYESSSTLANIVDDYLNISRIELGTMKYTFETISLKDMVENVIAELKPNIEKSKLAFTFKAEDDKTGYNIHADKDKLKQVIANLIDNSVKYTPSGSVKVTLSRDVAGRKIVFKLQDTGIGIDPQVLPLLFQKFTRANNANKVNIKGTGLGLFVAKEIVTAHKGVIRVESPGEGKGSTFIVELEPGA